MNLFQRVAYKLLLPLALLGVWLTPTVHAQSDAPPLLTALVTRVVDGSTLDAQVQGARTPVGYLGISAPDLNQPCGQDAFERNRELAAQGVLLEADPLYSVDEHHRLLFYAYTPDGTFIDQTLVSEGLAHATRTDAAHGADLAAAEADAAAAGRGCLWIGAT